MIVVEVPSYKVTRAIYNEKNEVQQRMECGSDQQAQRSCPRWSCFAERHLSKSFTMHYCNQFFHP